MGRGRAISCPSHQHGQAGGIAVDGPIPMSAGASVFDSASCRLAPCALRLLGLRSGCAPQSSLVVSDATRMSYAIYFFVT